MDIHKHRREYKTKPLQKKSLESNPYDQFRLWLEEAARSNIIEPNAMVLATATKEGKPSSRTVLLKGINKDGLLFFTNYQSRKAKELDENPHATATFYWGELIKQVTVEGTVSKVSTKESSDYFATRPRNTQLGAWASKQGEIIPSRNVLDTRFKKMKERFKGTDVPCPDFWGGYRIKPHTFLFWQGRENRLHDYFRYSLEKDEWTIERLMP